jgi:signal transduction histidine kinase
MPKESHPPYAFLPEAMLPPWFVTDERLVVRGWHEQGYDLLLSVGKESELSRHCLSVQLAPEDGLESLWQCIFDRSDPENLEYISQAIRMLEEHIAILNAFNQANTPLPIEHLANRLEQVESSRQEVIPFVYQPKPGRKRWRMGVKVSPIQGIKLMETVKQEGGVEYVDLVMAYRLEADWDGDMIRRLAFLGVQPALHDATERHRLWETAKSEEQAQITQFLSHALKTPISNIQFMVRDLQGGGLPDYYQSVCEKLEAQVGDLSDLSDLILFINAFEPTQTSVCASPPPGAFVWETVSVAEIRDAIGKTLQSVCNGRTRDPGDKKRLWLLAGAPERPDFVFDVDKVTDVILDTCEIGSLTSLGLILPPNEVFDDNVELAAVAARQVKTTFLNLLLVELLLNAIKYSDAQAPIVRVRLALDAPRRRFEIHVLNNGLALKESEFNNALTELVSKPGEKRRALGMMLNHRAANRLGWELRWQTPARPGTHLVLSIPFHQ